MLNMLRRVHPRMLGDPRRPQAQKQIDVIDVLSDLFILRGVPAHIRPTTNLSSWPRLCGMDYGSRRQCGAGPWENGYVESFDARLREEPLDGEIFYTLREAHIIRPHAHSAARGRPCIFGSLPQPLFFLRHSAAEPSLPAPHGSGNGLADDVIECRRSR
jgi:putative transposase